MQTQKSFKIQPWSLEVGDFIGMESSVDLEQNAQVPVLVINGSGTAEKKECLPRSCSVTHDWLTTTKEEECLPPIRTAERRHRRSLSVEHDWQTTAREEEFPSPISTVAKVRLRQSCSVKHDWQTTAMEKEFPPPMSSQRVLKRCYSIDGRLIIREEEVRHLDYSRSNGRLTLKLIPPPAAAAAVESFKDEAEEKNVESKPQDHKDADEEINNDGEEVAVNTSPGSGEGGVKCYRPLPCSFGMPAPAIRPCTFRIV